MAANNQTPVSVANIIALVAEIKKKYANQLVLEGGVIKLKSASNAELASVTIPSADTSNLLEKTAFIEDSDFKTKVGI